MPTNTASYRRNIPLFIAFRVLFNARWYYPILAVLFLDYGLSIEQYALLNVAWAAAIVGLEVPSGALADQFGRKKLVVFATILMVFEMAVFAFAPLGNVSLLFILFLINRVVSGAAEASASGADEALAYDSLVAEGRGSEWPHVLERLGRWQSTAFFTAMLLGAAVYDERVVNRVLQWAGLNWHLSHQITMRFPVYLTLGNALLALLVTLQMREPRNAESTEKTPSTEAAWRETFQTGKWILATPVVLLVILTGLCFDSIVRLFLTIASNYYRLIKIPDGAFGVIGAGFALFGFFVPSIARRLVKTWNRQGNFLLVAGLVLTGLAGLPFVWKYYGLVWIVPLGIAMSLTQFYISNYLNEAVTDSKRRATVLSFRGLAFNLAYGGVGLLYAGLTRMLSAHAAPDAAFVKALAWLPWYFVVTALLLVFTWVKLLPKKSTPH